MTDDEVSWLVNEEFKSKTLGVTEQYLAIHQPVYHNGLPKIDRIDREKPNDQIIAYLPVKGEYFFFAVYVDTVKKGIFNIGTESRNIISLHATSEMYSSEELQSFTTLSPIKAWNKGDLKSNGKSRFNFSGVEYELNPEPDEFEDKLLKLLILLKKDKPGVLKLVSEANANIQVIMDFHAGNQLLGGAFINLECIKIMNDLNLEISFDFNAWGESFK